MIFLRKLCPDVAVFTFLSKTKVMTEYLNPRGKKQNNFRRYLILKLVKKEQKNFEKHKSSNPEALQCWKCITHPPLDKKREGGSSQDRDPRIKSQLPWKYSSRNRNLMQHANIPPKALMLTHKEDTENSPKHLTD